MPDQRQGYDVVVIGGGNAGLCAALTARQAGARVIVLESAPRHFRGGNSRHTRNLRCAHAAPTDVLTESYPEDEFLADLIRVTEHEADQALARLLISAVRRTVPAWMRQFGVRFQSSLRGTLHLARTNAFFLGGGKALMNSYYAAAERARAFDVVYDAEVVGLDVPDGTVRRRDRSQPAAAPQTIARPCARRRRRRVRVEPRVAARGVGERGRQLHHSRHAVQHRHGSCG